MFNTTASPNLTVCTQTPKTMYLIMLPPVFVVLLFNVAVLAAATLNRVKLKSQNYTYSCVSSTLLSNVLVMVAHCSLVLRNYVISLDPPGEGKLSISSKLVWVFVNTLVGSLVLVVLANIGALVIVTLDSTQFVGPNMRNTMKALDTNGLKRKRRQKIMKAWFLILGSWVIPIAIVISSMSGWNCADICKCTGGSFLGETCPRSEGCSRVFPPLKFAVVGMVGLVWLFEAAILLYIIHHAVQKMKKVMTRPQQHSNSDPGEENEKNLTSEAGNHHTEIHGGELRLSAPTLSIKDGLRRASSTSSRLSTAGIRKGMKRMQIRFNTRLRFLISLTVLFLLSTITVPVTVILDGALVNINNRLLVQTPAIVGIYLYFVGCPILFIKFVPHMKTTLHNAFCKIPFSHLCSRF
uniref:G-protein coupled receptors family 1 profile domain-containing protein n=1 Tax=Ciona savignyi TaxID=51511 RepID=H2ZHY0_CIOSA